ncbi:MAG: DUF853 family protein [Bacilli bacterium]|nr:DUF853 family protein [Bacilli bacterium]
MYRNEKLLIGKNSEKELYLLPNMANRHGIITGASGSGKTVTLKVMAESFSEAGVPVFLVDVKGDLAGMAFPGEESENVLKRVKNLELEDFEFKSFPTTYYDVFGKRGHPIRTTVSSVGPRLLARLLDLTDSQEEILGVVFKISEVEKLELIDLNDLDSMLGYVNDKRKEYSSKYGNIPTQSITTIKRAVLNLNDAGGNLFFGKPSFDIKDFMKYDSNNGYGYINILDAVDLFKNSTMYVVFLLWLLTTIYNEMPEVGDLNKPKLVFFFDEAHLIFSEMKDSYIKQLTSIVKLIRSKGIGVYFISQSPTDIKDDILSQLGNRVQHVLRAYTSTDEKSIVVAAKAFRKNPNFDAAEVIRLLGTGEALVSFQNEKGEPEIVEKVTILPPQSRMGTITDEERKELIKKSRLYQKYDKVIDEESAFEKIEKTKEEQTKEAEKEKKEDKNDSKKTNKKNKTAKKIEDKIINKSTTKLVNYVFKKLFK